MIRRIALLGVGLIGGSLGLAWGRQRPGLYRVGYDRPEVVEKALARGAIDEGAERAEDAVREADLVVLATPLATSLHLLEHVAPVLPEGCLVTDVGSVKVPIVRHAADVLGSPTRFVGGHPMAGAERGGIDHADPFLFENATYVLCPPPGETAFETRYAPLVDLVRATGARVLLLDAERHDRIAATVSHLPQLLAVALVAQAADQQATDPEVLALAAGGFRDMTRIASSPFDIWRDILPANQGPILDALARFATLLQRLRNRLIEEDLDDLARLFARAREVRNQIPRDMKGFLHPLVDVFVYAEDRPGALLEITRTLYEAGLSIKDIELLKLREGTGGTFRLGFSSPDEADQAVAALASGGCRAYRL
ncbi:MAG: prephenate dehydrogenase [Rhodothermaceae bacterium]|nr:MAG: prephenate dehydrogenase [Rhodothermaceae bacterium]